MGYGGYDRETKIQEKEESLRESLKDFTDEELRWELVQRHNDNLEKEVEQLLNQKQKISSPY